MFYVIPVLLAPLAILLLVAVGLILWAVGAYNRLVREREFVRNGMAQIAAQIESRWDALTNMIDATKQYADYEGKTLESITASRTSLNRNASVADVEKDDALFSQALNQLYAVAENYPDLKAAQVYRDTMAQVDKYENQVRQSRMVYNDTVTKYNRTIQSVPTNIVAGLFQFTQEAYFDHSAGKSTMPTW